MPKMKTVRGAAKRFKVKKNSIKRGAAFRSHILTKKPSKRMRGLKEDKTIACCDVKRVERMLAKV